MVGYDGIPYCCTVDTEQLYGWYRTVVRWVPNSCTVGTEQLYGLYIIQWYDWYTTQLYGWY